MTDSFSALHPALTFCYFAAVLLLTMFVLHPVFLALSLLGALGYCAQLRGRCHALPSRVPQPSDACAAATARICAVNFGTKRSAMLSSRDTLGSTLPNSYRYLSAVKTALQH